MPAPHFDVLLRSASRHTPANLSGGPARYLLVCTPAGFERSFARLVARAGGGAVPGWAQAPYPETIVVGPQIGGDDGPGGAP